MRSMLARVTANEMIKRSFKLTSVENRIKSSNFVRGFRSGNDLIDLIYRWLQDLRSQSDLQRQEVVQFWLRRYFCELKRCQSFLYAAHFFCLWSRENVPYRFIAPDICVSIKQLFCFYWKGKDLPLRRKCLIYFTNEGQLISILPLIWLFNPTKWGGLSSLTSRTIGSGSRLESGPCWPVDEKPKTEGLSSELLSALATLKQYDTECKFPSWPPA